MKKETRNLLWSVGTVMLAIGVVALPIWVNETRGFLQWQKELLVYPMTGSVLGLVAAGFNLRYKIEELRRTTERES